MSKRAKQDLIACGIIYVFMLFCFWQTFTMKAGSELMPRLILTITLICNTALVFRVLHQARKNTGSEEGYTSISEIKIPILMFLGIVLYCVMFTFTNYFIATAIMLLVFMLVEKVRPLWKIVAIDVIYLVFIYVLFVMVLKVPLLH